MGYLLIVKHYMGAKMNDELLGSGLRPFELWGAKTKRMLRSWQKQEASAGYKTGLIALDYYIRLVPGELTVLAARPGMGKTAAIMQIAGNIVPDPTSKERVAIFSAEMSGWSLYMRLACAVAQVNMFTLRSGKATDLEYSMVERAIDGIKRMPLLIDDRSRPNNLYLRDEMGRMSETYKLNAMMFDFMELLDAEGRNEEQRVSNAVLTLKEVAKDYNVPVLAISHLSRGVEERADKFPYLSDLRYSGMIEQIADQVLLMTRPRYYLDKGMKIDMKFYDEIAGPGGAASNVNDIAYISIAKNRNGDTGIVRLGFDGPNMRFYDIVRKELPKAGNFSAMSEPREDTDND